jgi:hypothetical protein
MNKIGSYTIEIVCSSEKFLELAPQLSKLDKYDMITAKRTYLELEHFYYKNTK